MSEMAWIAMSIPECHLMLPWQHDTGTNILHGSFWVKFSSVESERISYMSVDYIKSSQSSLNTCSFAADSSKVVPSSGLCFVLHFSFLFCRVGLEKLVFWAGYDFLHVLFIWILFSSAQNNQANWQFTKLKYWVLPF